MTSDEFEKKYKALREESLPNLSKEYKQKVDELVKIRNSKENESPEEALNAMLEYLNQLMVQRDHLYDQLFHDILKGFMVDKKSN